MVSKSAWRWYLQNFEEATGAALLLLMALLAFANVLTRYFIKYSFASTEELEVAAMVWLTMLGSARAFKLDLHLRLVFLDRLVGAVARKWLHTLALLLSLTLFLAIAWLSYFHLRDLVELEITTEALGIPETFYVAAVPLGSLLVCWRVGQRLWWLWRREETP